MLSGLGVGASAFRGGQTPHPLHMAKMLAQFVVYNWMAIIFMAIFSLLLPLAGRGPLWSLIIEKLSTNPNDALWRYLLFINPMNNEEGSYLQNTVRTTWSYNHMIQ